MSVKNLEWSFPMRHSNIEDINEAHGLTKFTEEEQDVVRTIRQTFNVQLDPCDRCVFRKYVELIQVIEYTVPTCRGMEISELYLFMAMLAMIGVSLAEEPNKTSISQIVRFIEISKARRELELKAQAGERILQS